MSKSVKAALATGICAIPLAGANGLPSTAQQPPPPSIATEILTPRAVFTDDVDAKIKIKHNKTHGHKAHRRAHTVVKVDDPSRTLVARFTLQPGARFPWHSHPGPVIVNVTQGELVFLAEDDCRERTYPTGTAFVDPGHGHTHTAYNATDDVTILVATFYEAPAEGPLLIGAPAGCPA